MSETPKDKVTVIDRRRTGITEAPEPDVHIKTPAQEREEAEEAARKFDELLNSMTPRQQRMVILRRCAEETTGIILLAQQPPPVTGAARRPTSTDVLFRLLLNQQAILEALWHLHADLLPGDEDFQLSQQSSKEAAAGDEGNGI